MVLVATLVLGAILLLVATRLGGVAAPVTALIGLGIIIAGVVSELVDRRPWGPAALAAGIGFVVALRMQLRARRRKILAAYARRHGLTFSKADDRGFNRAPYRLFALGDGRRLENVMAGQLHGAEVRAADLASWVHQTNWLWHRVKRYRRVSVVEASISVVAQGLSITPREELSDMPEAFALRDLRLVSGEFDGRFRVDADDRESAERLLDSPMVEWLLTLPEEWGIEIAGSHAIVHGPMVRPEDIRLVFEMADGLAAAFRR